MHFIFVIIDMKVQLKISVFLLLLFCVSCVDKKKNYEDCQHYMRVINNSSFTIYAHMGFNYPDTLGFTNRFPNPVLNDQIYKVASGDVNTDAIFLHDVCLETRIKSKICSSDTMMVFLFREDSLKANDWKDAADFVLKRYDLTIDDLNAINWTITYP